MRICKLLLPLLASTLAFAAQPDRIPASINASQTVILAGHVPLQAQSKYDAGPVEPSFPMTVTVLFTPTAAQNQDLQQLLVELQDTHSPNFHKWLTPEEFGERFGLSQADLGRINS